ncbi:Na-translocating system protein MpsC family protein [Bacillus sp. X1(2014)]|uniref:Na-translocating system protein MpsC family protein n=1 Tax=Bacillus sp. X1(2014) TaxID=1565991 RepID=UPI0011AAE431|nr:Na-translocating system protein MpsC family protein [Bacillus sp. X1(2014)]
MKLQLSANQLKLEIIKIYNTVNQELFGIGIKSQRIELVGDKVFIYAQHKRIPALKVLDETQRLLTRAVDSSIIDAFKEILASKIEETLSLPIQVIFKDYDPRTEQALTVVIFKEPIE